MPPQDLEAEMSLLGSMLYDQNREYIGLVLPIIPRDESQRLYRPDHRLLFETIVDLYDHNKPIELVVMEEELRRRNIFEEIGGREYLIELWNSVASPRNIEHYARIVRDKSLLRDLITATGEITQAAYDENEPAQEVLDHAERTLFEVTEQRVTNQPVSIREFIVETFEQIQSDEELVTGVPTGFTELDAMTGGFQFGDLIVIAARPSMGKTALGLSMLEHIGVEENHGQGHPAVFFSLEMSRMQVAQRLLCSKARVDMNKIRHARLNETEMSQLKQAADAMWSRPIFIDDSPSMSIMEVRAKARRLKMLEDIKVIFVDYLQLMCDPAGRENRQQEISAISRGLKALGRELEVPVVAMAQLNRQVEGRSTNRPRMSDLRESGAIEQDADVVILLHREEYYADKKSPEALAEVKGKAELIIDKQRNGPTGVVQLHFTPKYTRFDNAAADYIRDYGDEGYQAGMPYDGSGSFGADDDTPF